MTTFACFPYSSTPIFSKGPLTHYLPKGLVDSGLMENREQPGVRGRERGISCIGYHVTHKEKQYLRITAACFIPEVNCSEIPLPTPYLMVKLKTRASLNAEGQSCNKSPFTLAMQT